jgi:hypothetical protein
MWRRLPTEISVQFPRSVELPDGNMLMGTQKWIYGFSPKTGVAGKVLWRHADWGVGIAEYHPTGILMFLSGRMMLLRNFKTGTVKHVRSKVPHGKSLAVRKDGIVYSWSGKNKILTLDPREAEPKWTLYDWSDAGPKTGDGRVYSKWQYIREHDVFVGLSHHSTGVWIYKHLKEMQGIKLSVSR